MLDMPRDQLAEAASISSRTIIDFERGARIPRKSTLVLIRAALESAGVEFIPANGGGPGVRLRE